ncbi:MAG: HAD family hydrolase [Verrucomicrobia bacterium]|nr:HAD family hydrolase [Verrucomicrobiota bacterium]NDE63092.1 HAD family hydrolase [Chlamydiota bacterium]
MLVLFDLDDTLIETTQSIVEPRLDRVLDKMISSGLNIEDRDEALLVLERLNRTGSSSKEALEEFIFLYGGDRALLVHGQKIISDPEFNDLTPQMVIGSEKLLYDLKSIANLILVTRGDEIFQQSKMKKSGLPYSLFSKIEVTSSSKKGCYETILKEFKTPPNRVIVVADRIEDDLEPAKELGMVTVLYRAMRNRFSILPDLCVDYVIEDIAQLYPIVEERC